MGWFGKKKETPKSSGSSLSREDRIILKIGELYEQLPQNYWPEFDLIPFAHHPVYFYIEDVWSGAPQDPDFEAKSLSRDFGIKAFNLAALFYLVAELRDIPKERVTEFLQPSTPGADDSLAILFRKIATLAQTFADEPRYLCALAAGVVVDPRQDHLNRVPLLPHADTVEFALSFSFVLDRLKEQTLHDAVDVKYGEVEDDPEWRR